MPSARTSTSLAAFRLSAVLAAVAVSAGCASLSAKPEDIVQKRAQQRWDAMRADKFADAYPLVAPSYRKVKDLPSWRASYGPAGGWVDAKVVGVSCESDVKCTAVVNVSVINITPIRAGNTIRTAVDETWVREDGAWYFLEPL